MEWLLGSVCLPGWALLNRHIGITCHEILLSTDDGPFDFLGALLVHDDVELQKLEELTEFFRENLRQVLGFPALRKSFADTKHSVIAPSRAFGYVVDGCARLEFGWGSHRRSWPELIL
jgi:hypothetical protein